MTARKLKLAGIAGAATIVASLAIGAVPAIAAEASPSADATADTAQTTAPVADATAGGSDDTAAEAVQTQDATSTDASPEAAAEPTQDAGTNAGAKADAQPNASEDDATEADPAPSKGDVKAQERDETASTAKKTTQTAKTTKATKAATGFASWAWTTPARGNTVDAGIAQSHYADIAPSGFVPLGQTATAKQGIANGRCLAADYPLEKIQPGTEKGSTLPELGNTVANAFTPIAVSPGFLVKQGQKLTRDTRLTLDLGSLPCAKSWHLTGEVYPQGADAKTQSKGAITGSSTGKVTLDLGKALEDGDVKSNSGKALTTLPSGTSFGFGAGANIHGYELLARTTDGTQIPVDVYFMVDKPAPPPQIHAETGVTHAPSFPAIPVGLALAATGLLALAATRSRSVSVSTEKGDR